jgi:hypothetical protein
LIDDAAAQAEAQNSVRKFGRERIGLGACRGREPELQLMVQARARGGEDRISTWASPALLLLDLHACPASRAGLRGVGRWEEDEKVNGSAG